MAKPARGLPADFALNLPDDKPVVIGDFLDEAPPPVMTGENPQSLKLSELRNQRQQHRIRPEIVPDRAEERGEDSCSSCGPKPSAAEYCSLSANLTPKSKTMLEELVEHVRTYSRRATPAQAKCFKAL